MLVKELKSYDLNLIVIEATGGLETELIIQLQGALLPVALINPRQGRDFAKATGKLALTDAIDALFLAHFGEAMKPQVSAIESDSARQLSHRPPSFLTYPNLVNYNPVIKTFYDRLVERGKSKKLALTACVRKMLVILNAMVRDNQPWSVPDNLQPIGP